MMQTFIVIALIGVDRKRGTPGSPIKNWPGVSAPDLGLLKSSETHDNERDDAS
jgi:hypothetical protein